LNGAVVIRIQILSPSVREAIEGFPRIHISLVGFMNAGKSSITQQPTSIVDSTPGTTADTKVALMEIHQIGPCKLLDTAGVDEVGLLGSKKVYKGTGGR
jgi:predicted GTPase